MRDLDWHGYLNARDLGGLPTEQSPTGSTLFGRVARGPRRELITAAGWADAQRWGLSTVVDLRCAHEIGTRDGDPAAADLSQLTVIHAPTEDQDNPEFREVCFPILDSPAYWQHNFRILPVLVRDALQAIASAPTAVLLHCSAGRDRTGMLTALLLGNAGVTPAAVADDYAQSVRAMAGAAAHLPTADRQQAWSDAKVEAWIVETAPIVEDVATHSSEVFDQIALPPHDRARLRDLLTSI